MTIWRRQRARAVERQRRTVRTDRARARCPEFSVACMRVRALVGSVIKRGVRRTSKISGSRYARTSDPHLTAEGQA